MSDFPFVPLAWHEGVHPLIEEARLGHESLFLVGAPGVGKSGLLRYYTSGRADAERANRVTPTQRETNGADQNMPTPAADMCEVLLGRAYTPAAMLSAIMEARNQQIPARVRRKGTTVMLSYVATWLAKSGVHTVVLDEVQHASDEALFHAMLLGDKCRAAHSHRLSLVLLGIPEAAAVVQRTGQVGQRVPIVFPVPLLEADEIPAVCDAYPPVSRCLRALSSRQRDLLLGEVTPKAAGSIRRLEKMLTRAVRAAEHAGERLSATHIRTAINIHAD